MKQTILLAITILAAVSFSNAQFKPIPFDYFWYLESTGSKKTLNRTRRVITGTEFFNNDGTVSRSITETREEIPASGEQIFKAHILTVEKDGSEEKIKEEIWIGDKYYLLKGDPPKETELEAGDGNFDRINGLEPKSCRQYTMKEEKVGKDYATKYSLMEIFDDYWKGFRFHNYSFWYDGDKLLRKERVKGMLDPRTVESREITTYEYYLTDLKIEAPVK